MTHLRSDGVSRLVTLPAFVTQPLDRLFALFVRRGHLFPRFLLRSRPIRKNDQRGNHGGERQRQERRTSADELGSARQGRCQVSAPGTNGYRIFGVGEYGGTE